ncbi:MAG: hypothetical protein CSA65_06490 [Proteobacteria bacterium]|nr:MAG: hypothetical protein CSA65_06490 [Pseudomonadota bacterium]
MGAMVDQTDPLPSELRRQLTRAQSLSGALRLTFYDRAGSHGLSLSPSCHVVIGRSPAADLQLDDRGVSSLHARVVVDDEGPRIDDLGSREGTWVNGVRLESDEPRALRAGDRVGLGAAQGVVQSLGVAGQALASHDRFLERLGQEVARASAHRRPLSLAMIEAPPGPRSHVAGWSSPLAEALSSYQLAACYTSSCVELLLPELSKAQATALLDKLLAGLEAGQKLRRVVCSLPEDGADAQSLLHALRRGLTESSRQATSTPMFLPAERWLPPALSTALDRIAPTRSTVLLVGETGTGKERLARELHGRSPWAAEPFVALNCAAIPEGLLEATLFGHAAGAFTGASETRAGVFARAAGGTLFLDSVEALSRRAQGVLLDVLESGRYRPVGAGEEQESQARILASTRADLAALCAEGSFRPELRYRLGTTPLTLPPLRGRAALIADLARHFAILSAEENGVQPITLGEDLLLLLGEHDWPGNMRELRNVIERATLLSPDGALRVADLPRQLGALRGRRADPGGDEGDDEGDAPSFKVRVQRYERALILDALRAAKGNQSDAARRLRIPRRTLVHKLKSLGIRDLVAGGDESAP